jgi:hypothetical protein
MVTPIGAVQADHVKAILPDQVLLRTRSVLISPDVWGQKIKIKIKIN